MKLDQVQVELRPRRHAEAVDLGIRMGRRWWRPMAASVALIWLPILVVSMLAFWEHPWRVAFILWWLRPAIERLPLSMLSKAIFGEKPNLAKTMGEFRQLLLDRTLLLPMTLLRIDPFRNVRAPMLQLEKPKRPSQRAKVLLPGTEGEAGSVLIMGLLAEWALAFTPLLLLASLFSPIAEQIELMFDLGLGVLPVYIVWILVGGWLLAAIANTPFYVAIGFSLYLNRRTMLEGWDIEVQFRRMAARAGRVAMIVMLMLAASTVGFAQTESPDPAPSDVIQEVLADPVFGEEIKEMKWVFSSDDDEEDESGPTPAVPLEGLGAIFAAVIEPILWIVVILVIILFVVQILSRAGSISFATGDEEESKKPERLFGLDVTESSLPDDVVAEARRLWSEGAARAAIGLLYRASISRLVHQDGIELADSATETECLNTVSEQIDAPRHDYFRRLTDSWLWIAYAHRSIEDSTAESLLQGWSDHFEGRA